MLKIHDCANSQLVLVPQDGAFLWWGPAPSNTSPITHLRPWLIADLIQRLTAQGAPTSPVLGLSPTTVPTASAAHGSPLGKVRFLEFEWMDHALSEAELGQRQWSVIAAARPEPGTGYPLSGCPIWVHPDAWSEAAESSTCPSLGAFLLDFEFVSLRYLLLRRFHYRAPLALRSDDFEHASARMGYFYAALQRAEHFLEDHACAEYGLMPKHNFIEELSGEVMSALNQDLDTPRAFTLLENGFSVLNELLGTRKATRVGAAAMGIKKLLTIIDTLDNCLGLFGEEKDQFLIRHRIKSAQRRGLDEKEIELRIAERIAARTARDWAFADKIASELEELGVVLMDYDGGTNWRLTTRTNEESLAT